MIHSRIFSILTHTHTPTHPHTPTHTHLLIHDVKPGFIDLWALKWVVNHSIPVFANFSSNNWGGHVIEKVHPIFPGARRALVEKWAEHDGGNPQRSCSEGQGLIWVCSRSILKVCSRRHSTVYIYIDMMCMLTCICICHMYVMWPVISLSIYLSIYIQMDTIICI